jgi:hypothetical protein
MKLYITSALVGGLILLLVGYGMLTDEPNTANYVKHVRSQ